jgi:hypothetical protein
MIVYEDASSWLDSRSTADAAETTSVIIPERRILAGLCACCLGLVADVSDDLRTLDQFRKEAAAKGQSVQAQSDGTDNQLKLRPIRGVDSTPTKCPDPVALDFLKHQIAYQRTEELDPLKGLRELHAEVWQRGPLAAFYLREKLNEFIPGVRMTYLFGKGGLHGGGTCPVEKNWRQCIEGFAGLEYATDVVGTCSTTLEMRRIPAWKPSPNDQTKRRIADELRNEIEAQSRGVQEIVIRDFNPKDNQITMYLKMSDGDYYQGCGFHGMTEPHCEGWHLFGHAPVSSIRKWIFEKPYRLK